MVKKKFSSFLSWADNRKQISVAVCLIIIISSLLFVIIYQENKPKIIKENGLVAAFKFDDKKGCSAFDNSGNYHSATLMPSCEEESSPTWVEEGKENGALKFDGVGDYVDVLNSSTLNFTDKITIDVWIKYLTEPSSFNGMILTKYSKGYDSPYSLYSNSSEGIRFVLRSSYGQEYAALFPVDDIGEWKDKWHHVVASFDSKKIEISVDDKKGGTTRVKKFEIKRNSGPLRIGALEENNLAFNGIIDEVRIYNK